MKKLFLFLVSFNITFFISAQEIVKSVEEDYYDFLALQGLIERPYLGYRTITDSEWITEETKDFNIPNTYFSQKKIIFQNEDAKDNFYNRGIFNGLKYKIYSPDFYNSYNTMSPYGQNDGGMWQGKGFNSSFSAGVQFETYGFTITCRPVISFSQNAAFDYIKPAYQGKIYTDKADTYGYYGLTSIDAPQRFGDKAFFNFDFGDTELRYDWYSFTMGIGYSNLWLGPAQINPIIHSNNAATYPKFDFGLTKTNLDFFNIDFGDFEFRYWLGMLSESDYFDNKDDNNQNLIAGIAVYYSIPFMPNLTLGFNRTMLSKLKDISPYTTLTVLIPGMSYKAGYDESDQRGSITVDYLIPEGGVDIYLEWAKNDYNNGLDNIIRYPFHTQAFTVGVKKALVSKYNFKSQILTEFTYLESSMDYHFFYDWGGYGNSFYTHHKITQGYTNKGQYLGAGIGSGGNSQYLEYKIFYDKGNSSIFVQRTNPDLNYSYFQDKSDPDSETPNDDKKKRIRANFIVGVKNVWFVNEQFQLLSSVTVIDEHNPLNVNNTHSLKSEHRVNTNLGFEVKYKF